MVKLIYSLVSAGKATYPLHIRVNDDSTEAREVNLLKGIFVKLNVSEALEGIGGLKAVLFSAEHVYHRLLCRAVIVVVEITVLIKGLAKI